MDQGTNDKKVNQLAVAPKDFRQMLIKQSDTEESELCAVIEIQRQARGFLVRKFGAQNYVVWRDSIKIKNEDGHQDHLVEESESAMLPQLMQDMFEESKPSQTAARRAEEASKNTAASKIQRFWRRHIDMQVYKYYRDLINFKTQGDPARMLKCINPKESAYLDPASGTHVKFRLAGDRFPPNIYYKIFTHRPVQDLCANAPRDYTKSASKNRDMRNLHNRTYYMEHADESDSWYKRIENNGWRLVSDRLITHMFNDPVTWSTHNKKIDNFPHTKLLRQQDIAKRRKRKKIEWMKKMYAEGLIKAKATDEETINLIHGATIGMVHTVEVEGEDAVHEWEVDELLDWTTTLNYEDYLTSWKEVGTSSLSEVPVEIRLYGRTDGDDNFINNNASQKKANSSAGIRQTSNSPV